VPRYTKLYGRDKGKGIGWIRSGEALSLKVLAAAIRRGVSALGVFTAKILAFEAANGST
jgi:hypothetical protein